ncbi:MAG: formylglycine-generating enzyme family protein [Planctomycetes bacterium]|nr:formylglycine-generating enzyme family protein [Planctomycetota bacterium]MCP4861538.1 formylglycine-generating enzyme family protein [Planctomycetota bacterium]
MITTLLLSLPLALQQAPEQRPGLVLIPGGNTVIGADLESTIERIHEMPASAGVLAGECPRGSMMVDTFYISPTLVTNEMYLEFVNATGAMPPPAWAVISKERRAELIAAGKEEFGPGYKFDDETKGRWWTSHWQDEGQGWEMAPAIALEPVVSISFLQAQAYCAWAGLRPPTEPEWTRAARGDTEFDYPFGPEFDRNKVSHNATKPSNLSYKLLPVCSMDNASPFGIYDQVGLVHEFTDSRATKLDNWKSFSVDFLNDKGKVDNTIYPAPDWDSSRILIKGGSYRNQETNCRIDTRIGFERDSSASIIGFRVASSALPVKDSAYLRSQVLRSSVLGGTPTTILNYQQAIGVEKHSYVNMASVEAKRGTHDDVSEVNLPDTYAVFGPHTSLSLTPIKDPFKHHGHAKLSAIDKTIKKSGLMVAVAALYTDVSFADTDLEAGAYSVVYMPGLKMKDIEIWGGWVKGTERVVVEEEVVEESAEAEEGKNDKKKEKKEEAKKFKPSVDISGVELIPTVRHMLLVNNEGVAVAALPVIGNPAYARDNKVPNEITFREAKAKKGAAIEFEFKLPSGRGNAYGFKFAITPVDDNGNDLSSPAAWNPQ